jgi:hypothetical protein
MEGRGAPGGTLCREEGGSPVETHPPSLVLVDGKEEAEGRTRSGCGRCRLIRNYVLGWRLARKESLESMQSLSYKRTSPEDGA